MTLGCKTSSLSKKVCCSVEHHATIFHSLHTASMAGSSPQNMRANHQNSQTVYASTPVETSPNVPKEEGRWCSMNGFDENVSLHQPTCQK